MESLFRLTLFLAGVINTIPAFITFFPSKILASYGIPIPDVNFELLLRHRAVLLGIIGGLMIYSALTKTYYSLSTLVGLISMISFLLLFYSIDGEINQALTRVMKIDAITILVLLIGFIAYKITNNE